MQRISEGTGEVLPENSIWGDRSRRWGGTQRHNSSPPYQTFMWKIINILFLMATTGIQISAQDKGACVIFRDCKLPEGRSVLLTDVPKWLEHCLPSSSYSINYLWDE